jgi:hypothetical protein
MDQDRGPKATGPDTTALRAWRAVETTVAAGASRYDRRIMLPRLFRILPGEWDDAGEPELTRMILARLRRALRREWSLARARHWAYDFDRHIALAQAWRAEKRRYRTLMKPVA